MENTLKNIKITGLFGEKNIDWDLKPEVNVLVGKNGVGKSIILQLIDRTVRQEAEEILDLCKDVTISFSDNSKNIAFRKEQLSKIESKEAFFEAKVRHDKRLSDLTENEIQKIVEMLLEKSKHNDDDLKLSHAYAFNADGHILETEIISSAHTNVNAFITRIKNEGKEINALYDDIQEEIKKLKQSKIPTLENQVKSSLNIFFAETRKSFNEINKSLELTLNNGETISYQQLSSGERQLLYIFLKVANATENKALILMDEPEISLHLSWQKILINEMRKVNNVSQMIIVTHSPAIIMDGWLDCMVDIEDIASE